MKYAVPSAMLLANLVLALITATMWDLDASLGPFLFFTVFLVLCESSFLVLLLEIAGLGKTDPELEAKEEWIARAPFASQLSAAFGKLAIGSLTIFGLLLVFHMIVQGVLRAAEVNTAGTLGLALQIVSHVIGLIGGVLMMLHGHKLAKWRPVSTSLFIFRKEFIAYFHSPVAYIVISAFLLVIGFLFFQQFFLAGQVSLRPMFSMIAVAFVFISPAITMRLIAEEKRAGTIELLMTLPVGPAQIVIGKYLAALGLIAVALLLDPAVCSDCFRDGQPRLGSCRRRVHRFTVFRGLLPCLGYAVLDLDQQPDRRRDPGLGHLSGVLVASQPVFHYDPAVPDRLGGGIPLAGIPLRKHHSWRDRFAQHHLLPDLYLRYVDARDSFHDHRKVAIRG